MNILEELKRLFIPKKLWILRLYVALLTSLVELILFAYVCFSLYNILAKDDAFGDLILGYAGLYLVWICLAILFVTQVVSLFLNIHDNIEDVRNKSINPNFSIDVDADKEKSSELSIRSFITITSIIIAIILSFVNISRNITKNIYENQSNLIGTEVDGGIVFWVDGKGEHGLIADKRDLGEMRWEDAKQACQNLGNGWHLPTKDELEKLYESRSKVPNMKENQAYWTIEDDVTYLDAGLRYPTERVNQIAWTFNFEIGKTTTCYKSFPNDVRAVRAF